MHDGVDFEACVVPVVVDVCIVGRGVDAQISHDERLEQQAQIVQIAAQALGTDAQRGDGDRRVAEVPFRCLAKPRTGPQVGRERGLVLDDEKALQGVEIAADGALLYGIVRSADILGDRGQGGFRGDVSRQRLHET